jgi:putative drug exporter of the RND superfamily
MWDRLAEAIATRPGQVLAIALVPILLPILALPGLNPSHDVLSVLPPEAESVRGLRALEEHLPPGETSPVLVVLDAERPLLTPDGLRTLGELSVALRALPEVASVRSAALPTDGRQPDDDGEMEEALQRLAALADELAEAGAGARAIAEGAGEVGAVLARIEAELPALVAGLQEARAGAGQLGAGADEAAAGAAALRDGVAAARAGLAALRAGAEEARGGAAELRAGAGRLSAGLEEATRGVVTLRTDVADPATEAIIRAAEALDGFTLGRADPRFLQAAEAVGETFALLTGRFPPYAPNAGQRVQDGYDGLGPALAELGAGIGEAGAGAQELTAGIGALESGLDQLVGGLAELDGGLAEIEAGLAQLAGGGVQLAEGGGELAEGLGAATGGAAELQTGVGALREGVQGELAPGASELAAGLEDGAAELDDAGLEGLEAVFGGEQPFLVTAALLDARPEVREALALFTALDERRSRMFISLAVNPFSDEAIRVIREIDDTARRILAGNDLADVDVAITGSTAFISEIDAAAARDFPIIVGAVLLGVFLVLCVLLRSVVIALYMVATVLLTYAAALGGATFVFQTVLGEPGLQWWLPSFLFVLLVVLGVDYSIFLMSRVREEAGALVTREAVSEGIRRTGRVITSCGLILAGTFAALLAAPLRSLAQLGLAATIGILLDTFVVRALIVPSIATLLGRHNWWPSSRARAA